ncbi:hypothetical protein [Nocardia asiatica]
MPEQVWYAFRYAWNCLIQMMGDIAVGRDGNLTDEAARYFAERFTEGMQDWARATEREQAA